MKPVLHLMTMHVALRSDFYVYIITYQRGPDARLDIHILVLAFKYDLHAKSY